jgi:acetyl-CoA synthetase
MKDEDGYFWFQGRKDDVIISSGYRIGPEEVEGSILRHKAVADCAVAGKPDEDRGEIVKAFVKLKEGFEPSDKIVEEIQQLVREGVGKHAYPREVEFIDEIPATPAGKIQRFKLREREKGKQ